jgi:hypothetical protein
MAASLSWSAFARASDASVTAARVSSSAQWATISRGSIPNAIAEDYSLGEWSSAFDRASHDAAHEEALEAEEDDERQGHREERGCSKELDARALR